MNGRKACGPDGIKGKILRMCFEQLGFIFSFIMNEWLSQHSLPSVWKQSEIIPVLKKENVTELSDLRPIALTSVVMKFMEKIILRKLRAVFDPIQDPFQFAYRQKRGVEDEIIVFLDNIYKHIDKPRTYCRILFVDFSSAFNTIQPSILLKELIDLDVNSYLSLWINSFLTEGSQYVRYGNVQSNSIITNTGCVLSPVLFTLYTNDFKINDLNTKLLKFADDSSILGLIDCDCDESNYRCNTSSSTTWCEDHCLSLNVKKTKELVIDFRIKKNPLSPLVIKDQEINQVQTYKYLGVIIDDKLNWQMHSSAVCKKLNRRIFFLRKLRSLKIDAIIVSLFYRSTIQSILSFCIAAWGGNIRYKDKCTMNRIIKKACKICSNINLPYFDELLLANTTSKIHAISIDVHHPIAAQIVLSSHRNKPIYLKCKKER